MDDTPDILCIGALLWDVIGRTDLPMRAGDDLPGRIEQHPGGVALNVAMTLVRFNMRPAVLGVVGNDDPGHALLTACEAHGVETTLVLRHRDLQTDRYMAIESHGSIVAALADATSLEAAGSEIWAPLEDGRLGSIEAPYRGVIVLDGNLSEELLGEIAESPLFAEADLRVVPASPGKATRLRPFLGTANATLYVNLEEACLLTGVAYPGSAEAARGLVHSGTGRALVTDGSHAVADACAHELHFGTPPQILARRATGAGDTFVAAHIASESEGRQRDFALGAALQAAATFVAGHDT